MIFVDFENLYKLFTLESGIEMETQRTASMSASTPANPSNIAKNNVNSGVFPSTGGLLIRFRRRGRVSNTFSTAEEIVS